MNIFKDTITPTDKIVFEKGVVKGTRIIFYDKDGNPYKTTHNSQVLAGSQLTAMRQFGLQEKLALPNYNRELKIDSTDRSGDVNDVCCLWMVGKGGCGDKQDDIYPVRFADRIKPADVVPFQYRRTTNDLTPEQKSIYYGRKQEMVNGVYHYAYYYKVFDTEPQLKIIDSQGTQLDQNPYDKVSDIGARCYVEVRLKITSSDFRDWFLVNDDIGNCRINQLSLLTAHKVTATDGSITYKNVRPLTQTNFSNDFYNDLTLSSSILYQIFY